MTVQLWNIQDNQYTVQQESSHPEIELKHPVNKSTRACDASATLKAATKVQLEPSLSIDSLDKVNHFANS